MILRAISEEELLLLLCDSCSLAKNCKRCKESMLSEYDIVSDLIADELEALMEMSEEIGDEDYHGDYVSTFKIQARINELKGES